MTIGSGGISVSPIAATTGGKDPKTTYATNPAILVGPGGVGPYSVHIRDAHGYGSPVGSGPARLTWIGVEVLHTGNSFARVSWFGVEVLRSVAIVPPNVYFKTKRSWMMTRKHHRPVYTTVRKLSWVPTLPPYPLGVAPLPKPAFLHRKPKHHRPAYTVRAKLSYAPIAAQPNPPYGRVKVPWQHGYDLRHHNPQYTIRRSAIVQPPLKIVPPHRKRKPWEMKSKHTRPQYTTVALHPWKPSPVAISGVVREVLRENLPKIMLNTTVREVLHNIIPKTAISQVLREVLSQVFAKVGVSQTVREVLNKRFAIMSVTAVRREVLHDSHAKMNVTVTVREVLRSREPFPRPDQQSPATDTPMVTAFKFGDGYTQRAANGVGQARRKQTLSWVNLPPGQAERILDFLERMNGSYPFMWTPNGEDTPRWFIAEAWKVKELNRRFTTIYDCELVEATKEQIHGYNYEPPWLPEAYN